LCFAIAVGADTTQSPDFPIILAQYRGTEANAAVARLAAWSDARVRADAQLPTTDEGPWSAAAFALLHLEAGLFRVGFTPDDAHVLSYGEFGAPGQLGQAAVDSLIRVARTSGDDELLEFCRDWYIVLRTALFLPPRANSSWAETARRQIPDDAQIQLLVGAYGAYGMGPRREGDSPYGVGWGTQQQPARLISVGGEEYNADETRVAEVALRKALELDPSLVEARLRLGRVYQLINRRADALRELQTAAKDAALADERLTGYLAELFLGQLHETADRKSEAIAAYERATGLFPSGYVARLALGQALIAAGKADEGWAISRSVFGQQPSRDPWSRFPAPGYWRITERLSAMRAKVSKTPLKRLTTGQTAQTAAGPVIRLSPELNEPTTTAQTRVPVFRSGVDSVRVDALVTQDGQVVSGLLPRDFVVTDNGVRQPLESVTLAKSVSAAVVVDTSRSMSHPESWRLVESATSAVRRALTSEDTFSLLTVSDRLALRADLVRNPDALSILMGVIRAEAPPTMTSVWDAVFAGGALVAESPGRALVLLVSDGWDNASWFHRRRALNQLGRLGLAVDAIAVPFQTSSKADDIAVGDVSLRPLEASANGVVIDAGDPNLGTKLADRFSALRQSYVLVYTPTNVGPQRDGWHEIKVTLRPGVKGKVQARPGYYAPAKK
jgi:VWFA-related protein